MWPFELPKLSEQTKLSHTSSNSIIFVSPELSSVRDYVITHSVRSMYVGKIDHCIHIHWCIVMGLGHNDPWVESHMWPQQTWGQRSSRGQWPLVQVFGKKGQCIHILWCIFKTYNDCKSMWSQKAGETRGSRTALLLELRISFLLFCLFVALVAHLPSRYPQQAMMDIHEPIIQVSLPSCSFRSGSNTLNPFRVPFSKKNV